MDEKFLPKLWDKKLKGYFVRDSLLQQFLRSDMGKIKTTWKNRLKRKWGKLIHKIWLIWMAVFNEDKIEEYYREWD